MKTRGTQETATQTEASYGAAALAQFSEPRVASVALAVPPPVEVEVLTEARLNELVESVRQLKGEAAVSYWRLGERIRAIYDLSYWKLRTEKSKPRWKTFDAFCHHELHMTAANARNLMDVATNFTEDQVRAFGHKKLGLLLQAPEDARPALAAKIEAGASTSEVAKRVQESKAQTGYRRPSRDGRRPPAKETKDEAASPPKEQVLHTTIRRVYQGGLRIGGGWQVATRESFAANGKACAKKVPLEDGKVMRVSVYFNPEGRLRYRVKFDPCDEGET